MAAYMYRHNTQFAERAHILHTTNIFLYPLYLWLNYSTKATIGKTEAYLNRECDRVNRIEQEQPVCMYVCV